MLPITFVAAASNVPLITPPIKGSALPRLMAPFSPNLVKRRKPAFWLIAITVLLEMFFMAFVVSYCANNNTDVF